MNSGALLENWAWMAGAVAVNVLWQGIIVAAVAAFALRMVRTSAPEIRYRVALMALLGMVSLIPINAQFINIETSQPLPLQAGGLPQVSADVPIPRLEAHPDPVNQARTPPPASYQVVSDTQAVSQSRPEIKQFQWQDIVLPWAGRIWLVGIIAISGYDLLGLFALTRLRRRGRLASPDLLNIVERISERMQVKTSVQVRIVEELSSALVTGFFRVVILLPAAMISGISPEGIEAIIAHEFAHIRRWDRWFNGLQRIAEALLFFHPVVWWLSRVVRAEREMCCDAMVLRMGVNRVSYVQALYSLAQNSHREQAFGLSSHDGNLLQRVRTILHGPASPMSPLHGHLASLTAVIVIISLSGLIASLSGNGQAEELPERVLRFPSVESVGTLYGRWSDQTHVTQPWMPTQNSGWSILSEAKGEVLVPANTQLKLSVYSKNLSFLSDLAPDALYFLECHNPSLVDTDIIPISHLNGLRGLDISYNENLTGRCLGFLGALQDLEWLDMQKTPVFDLPPDGLTQFTALKYIAGHFGEYCNEVLRQIAELDSLEFACLKDGLVGPDAVAHLSGKTSLRGVVLENVQLSDECTEALHSLPNLLYLEVKKNDITDKSLEYIRNFPSLQFLGLRRSKITDAGVALLSGNQTLEEILLTTTRVTTNCLTSLATLPKLRAVEFTDTGVNEEVATAFALELTSRSIPTGHRQESDNPNAPKVGIVMSHFTATGPHLIDRPYAYVAQDSDILARRLDEANFDVYAVIEPGTEILGELPGILRKHGLAEKIVNGYDADALKSLDVVFIGTLYNARDELLTALDSAIQHGVGLANFGAMGSIGTSGFAPVEESNSALERITGMPHPEYTWGGLLRSECPVITSHPILGNLKVGDLFVLNPLDGLRSDTELPRMSTILLATPNNYPETFPVLYVRDYGKGRIVRGQWHSVTQPGIPFPGFSFYVRAINWAAHRDADAIW